MMTAMKPQIRVPKSSLPGVYLSLKDRRTAKVRHLTVDGMNPKDLERLIRGAVAQAAQELDDEATLTGAA